MIIQFGPIRSGTTLIYNILQNIFETQMLKCHKLYDGSKGVFIVTYRHPFDCIISTIQRDNLEINNKNIIDKTNEYLENGGKPLVLAFEQFKRGNNVVLLKYEKFVNDFDYIYEKIETFFKIQIPTEYKNLFKRKFNVNNVEKITKMFKDFSEYDKKTNWHGNHISKDKGKCFKYKKYLSNEQIKMIDNLLLKELKEPYIKFMEEHYLRI